MQSQNTNPPVLEDSNNNLAQDSEAPKKTATNMPYIIEYCPRFLKITIITL